jgi:hypothetical protein
MPRIAGKPLILIAAVSLELSIAGPLSAFRTPQTSSHDPQVTAEVIPTQDEVETLLARLGERVHDAELATVISPTVEREFVDAKPRCVRATTWVLWITQAPPIVRYPTTRGIT